jgi:hypothetical protein
MFGLFLPIKPRFGGILYAGMAIKTGFLPIKPIVLLLIIK